MTEQAAAEQAAAVQAATVVATAEKAAAAQWQAQHSSQLKTLQSQQAALHAQYTQLQSQSQSQPHNEQTVQQLTNTDADTITALQAHIALEVEAAVGQRLQHLRTSEPAYCEGDSEPTMQPVLDPYQSHNHRVDNQSRVRSLA